MKNIELVIAELAKKIKDGSLNGRDVNLEQDIRGILTLAQDARVVEVLVIADEKKSCHYDGWVWVAMGELGNKGTGIWLQKGCSIAVIK